MLLFTFLQYIPRANRKYFLKLRCKVQIVTLNSYVKTFSFFFVKNNDSSYSNESHFFMMPATKVAITPYCIGHTF